MLTYDWCFFSCGNANASADTECKTCGCPAIARLSQVERFRNEFERGGRTLSPAATYLHEPPELSALEVLLVPLGAILLGYIPRRFWVPRAQEASSKSHERL